MARTTKIVAEHADASPCQHPQRPNGAPADPACPGRVAYRTECTRCLWHLRSGIRSHVEEHKRNHRCTVTLSPWHTVHTAATCELVGPPGDQAWASPTFATRIEHPEDCRPLPGTDTCLFQAAWNAASDIDPSQGWPAAAGTRRMRARRTYPEPAGHHTTLEYQHRPVPPGVLGKAVAVGNSDGLWLVCPACTDRRRWIAGPLIGDQDLAALAAQAADHQAAVHPEPKDTP